MPEIVVKQDFEGFFERLVRSWVQRKTTFKHSRIVVDAGPWRRDAVAYVSDGDTIELSFYSALRMGFGSLTETDVRDIVELL